MKWEVVGADRQTGTDRTITIDADSEDSARRRGNRAGLLVSSVRPLDSDDTGFGVPAIATTPQQVVARPVPPPLAPQSTAVYIQPTFNLPISHPEQTGTSGFGIAALILAIVGLLICWIPFLGILAIPLGVIAMLVGGIGFIVSLAGGRSGVGLPVAGTLLGGLVVLIAVTVTGAVAYKAGEASIEAEKRRAAATQAATKPATKTATSPAVPSR